MLVPDDAPVFSIDPPSLFGRQAPLEVEIGAGKGDFIIARSAASPERNFLAVELPASVARLLAVRCGRAGLQNVRVARMDARTLVNLMLPTASVSAYHIYFPDPWPKERHAKHRLFTPRFVQNLSRTLEPRGGLYVATDLEAYAREIFAMLAAGGFRRSSHEAPGGHLSGFARKYRAAGKTVYSAAFEHA